MHIGVVYPQLEIGNDPVAIRDYIQAVEGMGFRHLLIYDHVIGASLTTRPNWSGPYNSETPFHEVFVLLGYAAAITTRLELVTNVLILPQRQTALVLTSRQAFEPIINRSPPTRKSNGGGNPSSERSRVRAGGAQAANPGTWT